MPCIYLRAGETTALICGVPKRKARICYYCGKASDYLCDFPVGKNKTCDRALCLNCAQKGVSENVDFCRKHFPIAKAAYLKRMECF